jgi:hypothetical protein
VSLPGEQRATSLPRHHFARHPRAGSSRLDGRRRLSALAGWVHHRLAGCLSLEAGPMVAAVDRTPGWIDGRVAGWLQPSGRLAGWLASSHRQGPFPVAAKEGADGAETT